MKMLALTEDEKKILEERQLALKERIEYINSQKKRVVNDIKSNAIYIREQLDKVIKKIELSGVDAEINICGIIQTNGIKLDDLCKELGLLEQFERVLLPEILQAEKTLKDIQRGKVER
ncbi:MAG: hypothetical protein ACOCQR_02485 [bacterium]